MKAEYIKPQAETIELCYEGPILKNSEEEVEASYIYYGQDNFESM